MKTKLTLSAVLLTFATIMQPTVADAQIKKRTVKTAIIQYRGKLSVSGEITDVGSNYVIIKSLAYGSFKAVVVGVSSEKISTLLGRKGDMVLRLQSYAHLGKTSQPKLVGIN